MTHRAQSFARTQHLAWLLAQHLVWLCVSRQGATAVHVCAHTHARVRPSTPTPASKVDWAKVLPCRTHEDPT